MTSEHTAESPIRANYFLDAEFRQTLHEIVDSLVDGNWVTLIEETPGQVVTSYDKHKAEIAHLRDQVQRLRALVQDCDLVGSGWCEEHKEWNCKVRALLAELEEETV